MQALPSQARRVVLAYAPFRGAELASWVLVLIYAFEDGGAARASLAVAVQLVPAGLFAPTVGLLTSRLGAGRVLVIGYCLQTAMIGCTGIGALAGWSSLFVYGAAALAATSVTMTRPAHAATLPGVCHTASDLVSANVATSRLESVGTFLGPLASVGLAGPIGVGGGLLVCAAAFAVAGALALPAWSERSSLGAVVAADVDPVRAGARILASWEATALVGATAVVGLLIGALDVMAVPFADRVLDVGADASGLVMGAIGAGGVLGSLILGRLASGSRLAPAFIFSLALTGGGLVAGGQSHTLAPALAGFALGGIGVAVNEGSGRALIQRTVREDLIGRVFGVMESLRMFALAAGAALAPPIVSALGVGMAFAVVGAAGVTVAVVLIPAIARIDRAATVPVVAVALLRKLPIFSALPPGPLEAVARVADEQRFAPGATIIREGDMGNRYYAIVSGSCVAIREPDIRDPMVRGDGFGERALLTNEPRNATVVCVEESVVLSIGGDAFLAAITNHAPSVTRATLIATQRSALVERV